MLNRTSPIPYYRQLADYLLAKIQEGVWPSGTQTPSEFELAELFRVSRNTAREALSHLERQGYIYRVRGKGTFVASSKLTQKLGNLTGFSEDVRSLGMTPSNRILELRRIPAPPDVADKLHVTAGDEILFLRRLLLANAVPYIVVTTYMPSYWLDQHRIEILQQELGDGSLYSLLENRYGVRLGYADLTICADAALEEDATLLGCDKGAPVLMTERVTFTHDDVPVEYTVSAGHQNRHYWTITLVRATGAMQVQASSEHAKSPQEVQEGKQGVYRR